MYKLPKFPTLVKLSIILLFVPVGSRVEFTISTDPNDVHFYLHPNSKNPERFVELLLEDSEPLIKFNFKNKTKTIFLIHGFISNAATHMPAKIRNEYLKSKLNYNIITVDWGLLSLPESAIPSISVVLDSFPLVVQNIPVVAKALAKYITFLVVNEYVSLGDIHLIGHSLGCHVAGRVGEKLKLKFGRKLGRISGLDPSGMDFQKQPLNMILDAEDASFVDVYHTNMGGFGYLGRMGHVDFYPNGGRFQPGCFGEPICSHNIATEVFAVTLNQVVEACECHNFKDLGLVVNCGCGNGNKTNEVIRAGEFVPMSARGQFFYTTSPTIRLCRPFEFNC